MATTEWKISVVISQLYSEKILETSQQILCQHELIITKGKKISDQSTMTDRQKIGNEFTIT